MQLTAFILTAMVGLTIVPLIRFGSLRMRNELRPAPERDPQLGRKFILEWFAHACILLVVGGMLISVLDAMQYFEALNEARKQTALAPLPNIDEDGNSLPQVTITERTATEWWNPSQRNAVALVVSGLAHIIVVIGLLLFFTNSRHHREVAVSFIVLRIMMFGAALLAMNTVALIRLFEVQDKPNKPMAEIQAVLIVVVPVLFVHLLWLAISGRKLISRSRSEPD